MAQGVALVSYQGGHAKVYLPNGAQSPKLPNEEVQRWIELGGAWIARALDTPPFLEEVADRLVEEHREALESLARE